MKQLKKSRFLPFLIALGFLFNACESIIIEDEHVNTMASEDELNTSRFNLNELPVVTDFSNLRVGDYTGRYLILTKGDNLPKNIGKSIADAGGEIVKSYPEIGVAVAISKSSEFLIKARKISSVESVTPDFILQYTKDPEEVNELEGPVAQGDPFDYQSAFFDGFQWAPESINAPTAWDNGYTGEGVRVAIIDGGIHSSHQDLAPNLDMASSVSTVPGQPWNFDTGTFWHGTHVAGIVASSGLATVGIAPKATLIGVKSLHSGSGAFEWVLEGMVYAATPQSMGGAGAQVINMSLGATIDYRTDWKDKEFREAITELQKIFDRVSRYAYQLGVTIIVAAGNDGLNLDDNNEFTVIPAQNQHIISVGSTGPTGWQLGASNFTDPAYYTNSGKSGVDIAAPGGTVGLALIDGNFSNCQLDGTNLSLVRFCYVFDMVFSTVRGTTNGSYGWAQGTSMAAPAVAGVVALIMESNGGAMKPAQVKTTLFSSSTDLGKPGNDEYYGAGYVNAAKALGLE
ncbi:S8 family serine peptidase [Algoriphagus lutimaris]|uniref:S8 family peptidase n=1 Tax=Algoriphagus lutimaris TaxID=613197 RepID=UPI00196B6E2A|nr:S8 family serine peptidase [Algoriphagus lutimaris]MBN3519573.1 S8 family serine peptidase [Algoriphagus lutimaris]